MPERPLRRCNFKKKYLQWHWLLTLRNSFVLYTELSSTKRRSENRHALTPLSVHHTFLHVDCRMDSRLVSEHKSAIFLKIMSSRTTKAQSVTWNLEDRADEKSCILARETNYNSLHLLPVLAGSTDKRRPSKLIPVLRDKKSSKETGRGWKCVHGSRKKWLGKMYKNKGKWYRSYEEEN